ncbi:MAG: hydroxyacylglutathione hydrolase [Pseudomonadota bacterium]
MLDVHGIPAFDDNYIWCLSRHGCRSAAVVDPGDEEPVLAYLGDKDLRLDAILITHRHGDHTGGVRALKSVFPAATVFGPAGESIPTLEQRLSGGDRVDLTDLGAGFEVMDVPGHTEGHIAYYGEGMLFCGDTLFAAGCGRVFSGTHEQLHRSLQRIAHLPGDTLLFCAHEYTRDNLGFALWVEPGNERLQQRVREVAELREQHQPTVPSLLNEELETNPFLRTAQPEVIAAAQAYAGRPLPTGEEVFTAIRTWKDREYD